MKSVSIFSFAFLAIISSQFSRAAEDSSPPKPALELAIDTPKNVVRSSEGVAFTLSFNNQSANDLLLNGGELLGNGSQIWSSLEAELKSEDGQRIPMILGWGVPVIAGRIYFLGVPLRARSRHTLSVEARDYLAGSGKRLKAGKYEIRFVYRGIQSPYRDSTQMPACWEGEVWSNTLRFEVLPE
jgi:hypothetical protein